MSDIAGVLSAVVTPFTGPDSELDEPRLRELIERTITAGIHGLVPCGSTGEFAAMSSRRRGSSSSESGPVNGVTTADRTPAISDMMRSFDYCRQPT